LPSENDHIAALVEKVSRGRDDTSVRELYTLYVRYLAAVCSRYLPDQGDVKDVLQESFIKIFSSIGRFEYRGESSLKAWMRRIVVNESITFLRKKRKVSFISFDHDPPEDIPDEDPQVEGIPQSVLQEMIKELPPGYRTVFNLYVLEQKSHREIASMLGITEKASASQFSRSRARLVQKITEYRHSHEE